MKDKLIVWELYFKIINAVDNFNKARFINKDTQKITAELVELILNFYQVEYTMLEKGVLFELREYLTEKINNSSGLSLLEAGDGFIVSGLTDETGKLIFKYEKIVGRSGYELNEYYQAFRDKKIKQSSPVGFVIPHAVAYRNKLFISPSYEFGVQNNNHQKLLYSNEVFICKTYDDFNLKSFIKVCPAQNAPVTSFKVVSGVGEIMPRAQFSVFENMKNTVTGNLMKAFSTDDDISMDEYEKNLAELNTNYSLTSLGLGTKEMTKKKTRTDAA